MKEENDIRLTRYFRKMKKRMDPLNISIRDGKLNKAFLLAMEIEEEARKFQQRLNELRWPKQERCNDGESLVPRS